MAFSPGSHARLTSYDLARFAGRTLFDRLGRALCEAGCLPRKELYEAWEVARRARRLFRGGRVVDLGGGHGLLAYAMLLLDDSSPSAAVVDIAVSPSGPKLDEVLVRAWPRLAGRVTRLQTGIGDVALCRTDVVVSSHACGALTDLVLERAVASGARVAVLPCCHDCTACDDGGLRGWLDVSMAIDATRALKVRAAGYRVRTQTIPPAVTPKNRLLLAWPDEVGASG
jgi:hypothetical protein